MGVVDLIFQCELALELKMTVGEIAYGRGTPMSLHELTVIWPAYYAWKRMATERDANKGRR
jgi:hypothetical protein